MSLLPRGIQDQGECIPWFLLHPRSWIKSIAHPLPVSWRFYIYAHCQLVFARGPLLFSYILFVHINIRKHLGDFISRLGFHPSIWSWTKPFPLITNPHQDISSHFGQTDPEPDKESLPLHDFSAFLLRTWGGRTQTPPDDPWKLTWRWPKKWFLHLPLSPLLWGLSLARCKAFSTSAVMLVTCIDHGPWTSVESVGWKSLGILNKNGDSSSKNWVGYSLAQSTKPAQISGDEHFPLTELTFDLISFCIQTWNQKFPWWA